MTEHDLSVVVRVDKEERAAVSAQIKALGLREERPGEEVEIDPIIATSIAIGAVSLLATLIIEVVTRLQGGTIIDLTKDQVEMRKDRALLAGTVLIITKDSEGGQEVKLEVNDLPKGSLERIVETLIGTGKDITKAALEALIAKEKAQSEETNTN